MVDEVIERPLRGGRLSRLPGTGCETVGPGNYRFARLTLINALQPNRVSTASAIGRRCVVLRARSSQIACARTRDWWRERNGRESLGRTEWTMVYGLDVEMLSFAFFGRIVFLS